MIQHVIGGVPWMPDKGVHDMGLIAFMILVSRFAVPAFIMCAGYVSVASIRKTTVRALWRRRLQSVVLPYVLWGLFYWAWTAIRMGTVATPQAELLWQALLGLLRGTHCYHLCFMVTLMELYVLLPLLLRLMDRGPAVSWALVALSIALAVGWAEGGDAWLSSHAGDWAGGAVYFCARMVAPWLMYALLGAQAAKLGLFQRVPSARQTLLCTVAALAAFAAAVPAQLELLTRAAGDHFIATAYYPPADPRGIPLFCLSTAAVGLLGTRASPGLVEKFVRLDALSFFGFLAPPLRWGWPSSSCSLAPSGRPRSSWGSPSPSPSASRSCWRAWPPGRSRRWVKCWAPGSPKSRRRDLSVLLFTKRKQVRRTHRDQLECHQRRSRFPRRCRVSPHRAGSHHSPRR